MPIQCSTIRKKLTLPEAVLNLFGEGHEVRNHQVAAQRFVNQLYLRLDYPERIITDLSFETCEKQNMAVS